MPRPPPPSRPDARPKPDWLSRALARAGAMPLAEAEDAIRAGRVSVDGRVVRQPLAPVAPTAVVKVDGLKVSVAPRTHVLIFHKPAGYVTSTVGSRRQPTVFEALLPMLTPELMGYHWHAVGRLDVDTTGLLLFTNDERFVTHATHPDTKLPRRYLASVHGRLDDEKVEPLRRGLRLEDGLCRPARVRLRGEHEVEVTITEGRNHQVKRMLGAVGLPVRSLHREAVGTVELDVPEAGWRLLSDEEVAQGLGYRPRHAAAPEPQAP